LKRTAKAATAVLLVLVLGALLSGCTLPARAESPGASLIGSWFDDASGTQYRFVSDHVVVVPREVPGGGNGLTYSRVSSDTIDIVYAGVHRVSTIDTLTPELLVLADPLTDQRQVLFRDAGRTAFASQLATAAVDHAGVVGSLTIAADIQWVGDMPTDKSASWTEWSPTTLAPYLAQWDWAHVTRAKGTLTQTTGGGSNIAFTFTMARKVPTGPQLDAAYSAYHSAHPGESSAEATAGMKFIDVGYSGSRLDYTAGTLVYLPGGLMFSLGDGYAIPVGLDMKNKGFVPLTHD
jgi:hypothetical protein